MFRKTRRWAARMLLGFHARPSDVIVASPPCSATAQSVSGTILGTVTDASGAVVSEAKITVINEGTGLTRTINSDSNGEYIVPSMPTGRYTVVVREWPASRRWRSRTSTLGVDQRARIDLKLEVGALTESVTIEAASAAPPDLVLRAGDHGHQRADRSDAAQRAQLRQPDPHGPRRAARHSRREHRRRRQPRVAGLGVVLGQRPAARATTTSCSTASTTTRRGSRRSSSSRALTRSTNSSCRPRPTRPSSAGRSAASSTCRSSRAPTLRGSGFEFHRNDAFDANNFFNNRAGRAKPTFEQNQFGGTLGGAIFRDKTFFFGALSGSPRDAGADVPLHGADRSPCGAATSPS